ncbi:uncharacterized protein [Macrobrachium rosenbergii]|uniref:uncharacterized protein isoform X1 n=1 Tax=Macrobrachium rosenbergii TaxID=79674 RepID=UPI0034D3DD0F
MLKVVMRANLCKLHLRGKLLMDVTRLTLMDIQEQTLLLHLLQELKKDVQELKEDVRLIKNRMDMLDPKCGENKTVETTLENPFEILRSFGFRANSLEELLEQEKQFSEEHLDSEKNRGSLLKVLVELAPKPKHGSKISALDIIQCQCRDLLATGFGNIFVPLVDRGQRCP